MPEYKEPILMPITFPEALFDLIITLANNEGLSFNNYVVKSLSDYLETIK